MESGAASSGSPAVADTCHRLAPIASLSPICASTPVRGVPALDVSTDTPVPDTDHLTPSTSASRVLIAEMEAAVAG